MANNSTTIALIVDKPDGRLGPSETFLRAHINLLPCNVVPLMGPPARRNRMIDDEQYEPVASGISRVMRSVSRRMRISTVERQDRADVVRMIRTHNISGVLAEYGPTAVSVMNACSETGTPLIAHFHGYDAYRKYVLRKYEKAYPRLFSQAAAIIAVSSHMRKTLIELGAPEEKTFHNSCGADVSKDLRADPASSECKFLMVGRLVDKKAPLTSIEAFAKVAADYPDAKLTIIGDGPLKPACEALVGKLGIGDHVAFWGARPHLDVLREMTQSRCFIQHSVCAEDGDREGTPVGVLEAMGLGLAVVATRHGGIADVISDGCSGSLVDEHDMEGMYRKMSLYAASAQKAAEIGAQARNEVLDHLTAEKSVARLWKIISRAAA